MSAVRRRSVNNYGTIEDEPPPKKLVSDADIYIKQLAEKQRNTKVTLQEQLSRPKEFCKGTETVPLAKYSAGTISLTDFQETTKHFDQIEMLKGAGLTDENILLYFDSLRGRDYMLQKHKNYEQSLLEQKLSEILKLIKIYKDRTLSTHTTQQLQKHEIVENGLVIKPDSIETKLLKFALSNEKGKTKQILPHPMNNIKRIEEKRFAYLNEPSQLNISKIRRKARKLQNRIDNASASNETDKSCEVNNRTSVADNSALAVNSKWDVTEKDSTTLATSKKVYSCLPQNYYTVRNGEIIKLEKSDIEAKGLKVHPKLTVNEIKLLPKFQDYEAGSPSEVLYLKNLSNGVTEEELRRLFKNYDKSDVTYRIMKGKMRGQAFVTFPDEIVAARALEDTNGTFIRNKPIVIQFGNKKNR